jgi:hypothetical protein
VLATIGGEIALGIGLGVQFMKSVNGNMNFNDFFSIAVLATCLTLWTLNYFIYGKYSITLRVFSPFLFTPVIMNETTSDYHVMMTFFILSIIVITECSSKNAMQN